MNMITSLPAGEVHLMNWNIIEFPDFNVRRFVGYSIGDQLGRLSTEIVEFDLEKSIGRTKSCSEYILIGEPGHVHPDGLYVLQDLLDKLPHTVEYGWVFPFDANIEKADP